MIGKEDFEELIQEHYKQSVLIDSLDKVFPGACGSPVIDYGWKMFDRLKQAYFTEEGVDWIDYFLYENPEKCYYQDGVRVPLETVDDLWSLIEPYRK